MDRFCKWCNNLKNYWINKDVKNIIQLFESDVQYYETPVEKITGLDNIENAWNEIKTQNTENLKYEILCSDKNKCIVNFILKDVISYDMIYEIELNEKDKCIYFRQWYMEIKNE